MKWYQMQLFHGSEQKLEVIRPMGINMGSRFGNPHWASFFWRTFDEAKYWAVFQYLRRVGKMRPVFHVPSGKFILKPEDVQAAKRVLKGATVYVYRVIAPFVNVGVGSSPDIHEFTLKKDQVPESTTAITVTDQVFDESVMVMSADEIAAYITDLKAGKYSNTRGLFLGMLLDRNRDIKRHNYHKLIASGELAPGDDLSGVSVEAYPITARW